MTAELLCIEPRCAARYAITEVIYTCPRCGGLLEVDYQGDPGNPWDLTRTWRERRMSNAPLDQSGVWRYRELYPFLEDAAHIVTLREGNTPLLDAPKAAAYAGLDRLTFKHQGFNPTGSFKDNGMTAGASQAVRLGMKRVACVSTGNTSASMAAYAAKAGLDPVIFIPNGNIAFGKLGQALDYGAKTLQVEANFDQILALVRVLAERIGIYLLNSVNPFRIEGQKSIVIEMLDQLDWCVPDWIVLPGGNLGNVSAFGKALRELKHWGFIDREPKLAVIQAGGARPFFDYMRGPEGASFEANPHPETLATAIKIGDPVSWPKAEQAIRRTGGAVHFAHECEIADAKAIIGQCGIGCEPASAASLAGVRKLRADGVIRADEKVVGILTGNVLKDPDYIYRYHMGELKGIDGRRIEGTYTNRPIVAPNDADTISRMLEREVFV
jgi:threonine synthase